MYIFDISIPSAYVIYFSRVYERPLNYIREVNRVCINAPGRRWQLRYISFSYDIIGRIVFRRQLVFVPDLSRRGPRKSIICIYT